jgi:hypothetical protein
MTYMSRRFKRSAALVILALIAIGAVACTTESETVTGGPAGRTVGSAHLASRAPETADVYLVPQRQLAQAAKRPKSSDVFKDFHLAVMTWTSWSATRAEGGGQGSYNLCDPDCAATNYFTGPIRTILTKPASRCGKVVYTKITVTWSDSPPPGIPRSDTIDIFDPAC